MHPSCTPHEQLFGGLYNEANGYGPPPLKPLPRYNFDSFVPAMLTCFVVTTGGWYAPMLDGVKVSGASASIYFVVVELIGTNILMNVLVAVLLQVQALGDRAHSTPTHSTPTAHPPPSRQRPT